MIMHLNTSVCLIFALLTTVSCLKNETTTTEPLCNQINNTSSLNITCEEDYTLLRKIIYIWLLMVLPFLLIKAFQIKCVKDRECEGTFCQSLNILINVWTVIMFLPAIVLFLPIIFILYLWDKVKGKKIISNCSNYFNPTNNIIVPFNENDNIDVEVNNDNKYKKESDKRIIFMLDSDTINESFISKKSELPQYNELNITKYLPRYDEVNKSNNLSNDDESDGR